MDITVLGKYGPFPRAGGACSGYLLRSEGVNLLLDCGNGVLSRLQQFCDITDLSGIILSHLHSDHISDIMVLRYGLDILRRKGMWQERMPVFTPIQPEGEYEKMDYRDVFSIMAIGHEMGISIKDLSITFKKMVHPVPTFGVCIKKGSRKLVYSGDTAYSDDLVSFVQGADLFICDGFFLDHEKQDENVPHMTAGEAARIAREGGVKRLMISHLCYKNNEKDYLEEAKRIFDNTIIAQEMNTYKV
ncbi:MAG TPA: MBL fold metallo-hydrolase [Clostridiales bacterium]|nr:MBL fold metallo-hydrolase [Clostridiales bacterium]